VVRCRSVLPVAVAHGHATFECRSLSIPTSTKLPHLSTLLCFHRKATVALLPKGETRNSAGHTQVPHNLHNLGPLSSRTAQHMQVIGQAKEDLLGRS
jgi:hypothetical protein